MLKAITLVGTRPELIKLSLVIRELDKWLDHRLVHSGQNFDCELNEVFFDELNIRKPDHFLEVAGGTAAEAVARVIERFDKVLEVEKPDVVVLLGDTNSCLGIYAAKRRRIPIVHLEAGNRCFDERVPEEINRRVVDHLSDVHLVYTEHARRYLVAEGIRPDRIFKTGSPMREILDEHATAIGESNVLSRLSLKPREYFLVSAHREENVDSPGHLKRLLESLSHLSDQYKMPVLFSTHPRTRQRLESLGVGDVEGIRFMKPLGFFDYVKLQTQAKCVLSDSGTLTEEASILNFPAVMLREAHERPEGMDEGTLIMTGINSENIIEGVRVACGQGNNGSAPTDYAPSDVSRKVVRIIMSYVDYVNRTSWFQTSDAQ